MLTKSRSSNRRTTRTQRLSTKRREIASCTCTLEVSRPKVMRALSSVTCDDVFVAVPVRTRRIILAICSRMIGAEWVHRPIFSAGFAHGVRLVEVIPLRRMLLTVPSFTRPTRRRSSTFFISADLTSNDQGTVVTLALISTSQGPVRIALFFLGGLVRMGWKIGCGTFFNAVRRRLHSR